MQLSNSAAPVSRLGIPAYQWWSESLHGIASNGPGVSFNSTIRAATVFPQVILTAASFNRTLWRAVAAAIAVEARAMYNTGQAGLTFWAPNINIFRDPRWGRGQETPGEDPTLVSSYAVEYVKGFQGEEEEKLMLSACCKHYIAYDLEKWHNFSRYSFDALVTEQDMLDTFQPPFKSCIEEGGASCLMCSYNQVNGVPACADLDLLSKARLEWGFNGYITSDCDAVAVIRDYQHYVASPEDAVADVLAAGMDINCGTYLRSHARAALKSGKLREDDIDRALLNLFSVQLRLGLYDGDPKKQRFGWLGPRDVCTENHKGLALDAARQGIVLLKNDHDFLPLRKHRIPSLGIIGPAADDSNILGGDYTGIPCQGKSLLDGLAPYAQNISSAPGCLDVPCNSTAGFEEALKVASRSDVVIIVAGLNLTEETEDHDRLSLLLPGKQMDLISAIVNVSINPSILIVMGGGPVDISFAKAHPKIASILWIGYPGEAGGQALAETLFGEFNPGGRVPVTWYPEAFTKVPMNDMHMRSDPSRGYPGRTYRFYTGETVYEFGYGLSYTRFSSSFAWAPSRISLSGSTVIEQEPPPPHVKGDGIDYVHLNEISTSTCKLLMFDVKVSVVNSGDVDGSQSVLLFFVPAQGIKGSPRKQLIGFERVNLKAGGSEEVGIEVDPCKHLSLVNANGDRILPLGPHLLKTEDSEHVLSVYA